MKTNGKKLDPIARQIFLKTRLIKNLRKEIEQIKQDAASEIKRIEFRIQMAHTLLTALQKGK